MPHTDTNTHLAQSTTFHPLRLITVILLLTLTISGAAQWYASNITLPRYCEEPVMALQRVRSLLTERRPAGDGDRKPYIIASRLTFLIPRESEEPLEEYISRLQRQIDRQCR